MPTLSCLSCNGSGKWQPAGPLDERDCLECGGSGFRHVESEVVLWYVREYWELDPVGTAAALAEGGFTYWDLYPDDRDLIGLPEGPSRDTEWAEAVG